MLYTSPWSSGSGSDAVACRGRRLIERTRAYTWHIEDGNQIFKKNHSITDNYRGQKIKELASGTELTEWVGPEYPQACLRCLSDVQPSQTMGWGPFGGSAFSNNGVGTSGEPDFSNNWVGTSGEPDFPNNGVDTLWGPAFLNNGVRTLGGTAFSKNEVGIIGAPYFSNNGMGILGDPAFSNTEVGTLGGPVFTFRWLIILESLKWKTADRMAHQAGSISRLDKQKSPLRSNSVAWLVKGYGLLRSL